MAKIATNKNIDDDDAEEEEDDTEEDKEKKSEEKKKDEEGKDDEKKDDKKEKSKYSKFYENFGKNIKLGIIEDSANKSKLAKLVRFYSTKNVNEITSLDEYIKRMKAGQEFIYFISGEDRNILYQSPLIQKLREKEIEVLWLEDPIDEYCAQQLAEYDKKKLKNVAKGDIKVGEDSAAEVQKEKRVKADFKNLIDWWKKVLGSKVESITLSKRLTDTPCVIVSSEYGYSANMERIQ
jgi:heat shock protein beta